MLLKDRAHLCTSKICLYLGHSDLVQLPHLIDEQRKAEGTPVVEMDTKGESRGRGGGEMNWEIGIDIYTLICIKLITNKNLLYKNK